MKIYLQPLGPVDQGLLDDLVRRISAIWDVVQSPPLKLPSNAYNAKRGQFDGSLLLRSLRRSLKDDDIVLGVTEADAYVEGLNFIFGLAFGSTALISLQRLRPEFYGSPHDEELFRLRAFKEAMHELGHVFGLGHCPTQSALCTSPTLSRIPTVRAGSTVGSVQQSSPLEGCFEDFQGAYK